MKTYTLIKGTRQDILDYFKSSLKEYKPEPFKAGTKYEFPENKVEDQLKNITEFGVISFISCEEDDKKEDTQARFKNIDANWSLIDVPSLKITMGKIYVCIENEKICLNNESQDS